MEISRVKIKLLWINVDIMLWLS